MLLEYLPNMWQLYVVNLYFLCKKKIYVVNLYFFFTQKIVLHWADNVKSVEIIQRIHQKIETICKKSMNFFVPNHRFWYFKLMSEKTKPNESPVFKINQLFW